MLYEQVYKANILLFHEDSNLFRSQAAQKVSLLLFLLTYLGQVINLIQNQEFFIPDWLTNRSFWYALTMPSIENLAGEFGLLFLWTILSYSLLGVSVFLWIFCILLIKIKKYSGNWLIRLLRMVLFFTCKFYFISILNTFIYVFKYSVVQKDFMDEFGHEVEGKVLDFGLFGVYGSILVIILHVLVSVFYEIFVLNVQHSMADSDLSAKSNAEFDICLKLIFTFWCILSAFIKTSKYIIYLFISLIISLLCLCFYIYKLPHYSKFAQILQALPFIEGAFITIFFLLAYILNTTTPTLILVIFLQPGIIHLAYFLISKRQNSTLEMRTTVETSTFELALRKHIKSSKNSHKIFKYINLHYKATKNKLFLIYLANYCNTVLENSSLASIKICQINCLGPNILHNFQVFKCQKSLEKVTKLMSNSMKLCLFLLKYDEVLNNDKEVCHAYGFLLQQILAKDKSLEDIRVAMDNFNIKHLKVLRNYQSLVDKFPNSWIVNKLYGSFLADISNKQDQAQEYLAKVRKQTERRKKGDMEFDFFSDPRAMLMVISGNEGSIGNILFASSQVCKMLDIPMEEAKKYKIFDFIPKPFGAQHAKWLRMFIENSLSQLTLISMPRIMCTLNGYLVECKITTECVGFKSQVNFVIIFEKVGKNKEKIALINFDGIILAHSKNFPCGMKINSKNIENCSVMEFVTENEFRDLFSKKCVVMQKYSDDDKGFYSVVMVLEDLEVFKEHLKLIKIVDDEFEKTGLIEKYYYDNCVAGEKTFTKSEEEMQTENCKKFKNEGFYESIYHTSTFENNKTAAITMFKKNYEKQVRSVMILHKIIGIFIWIILSAFIISNTSLTVYLHTKVNDLITINTFDHMGEVYANFALLGYFARSLDLNTQFNTSNFLSIDSIPVFTQKLITAKKLLKEDSSLMKKCFYTKGINEKSFSIWSYSKIGHVDYDNLQNYIDQTVYHALRFYEKHTAKIDYNEDLFFLLNNCYRTSLLFLNKIVDGMAKCEIDNTKVAGGTLLKMSLFFIVLIGGLFSLLCFLLFLLTKAENNTWKLLNISISQCYPQLKFNIKTRLKSVHNDIYIIHIENNSVAQKHMQYNHSKKFFIVIFCLSVLAISFFLTFYYSFWDRNYGLMRFRIDYLDAMVNRRVKLVHSAFFTQEIVMEAQNKGMDKLFAGPWVLPEAKRSYDKVITELLLLRKIINSETFKKNTPQYVIDMLYVHYYDSDNYVLKKGIFNAFSIFRRNCLYLIGTKKTAGFENFRKLITDGFDISESFLTVIPLANVEIKKNLSNELVNVIYFSVLWSLLLFIITILFKKYYFKRSQNIIKRIDEIFNLIPQQNSTIDKIVSSIGLKSKANSKN